MQNLEEQIKDLEIEKEQSEMWDEEDNALNISDKDLKIHSHPETPNVKSLYDDFKDGDLILQPDYQRRFVWDKKKASNLIESILLDIPIPPIFISEENGKREVIDGQQRLASIFHYMDNTFISSSGVQTSGFKLSKLKVLESLSGKKFKELNETQQKAIKKRALSVIVIEANTNKDIKFEMFNRLNSNITKLNNQELRNCLYRGKYNEFIKRLAQNDTFKKLINRPDYEKRMLTEELVLLYFTFLDKDYHQYKGNMKQLLNNNMENNKNITDKNLKDKEEKFKKSIDIIKMMFKDGEAFRIFGYDDKNKYYKFEKTKINQGLYLILMYWFSIYEKNQVMPYLDILREELLNLQTHNEDFVLSLTGSGTNNVSSILKKFDIWGNTVKNILDYPHSEPRIFSYQLKEQLFNENNTCSICGNKIHNIDDCEIDHIECFSKGGLTIAENARLTHRYCNRHRATKGE